MEPEGDLDPDKDDLPLRANTNHILVRHYVLDLSVHFDSRTIRGSIVLFLEPCSAVKTRAVDDSDEAGHSADMCVLHAAADNECIQSSALWQTTSSVDFTLVLDCCDLDVSKVEEVDVTSMSATMSLLPEVDSESSRVISQNSQSAFIQNLFTLPSSHWRQKHRLFLLCSRAPGTQDEDSLQFYRDKWSLQVRKKGIMSPEDFPRVLRIYYKTRPTGGSVRWTKDQDDRVCVYTAGSPINNRALFPCQEPPVAMSTWQATVQAPRECVVLMSGEEPAVPTEDGETRKLWKTLDSLIWNYYVTMPMPASTFTLAVGHWCQVTAEIPPASERKVKDRMDCGNLAESGERTELSGLGSSSSEVVKVSPLQTGRGHQTTRSDSAFYYSSLEDEELSVDDYSGMGDDGISCSHGDYPCRFTERSAWSQRVIPHRVFSPVCLLQKAQVEF